ncbi:MAG: hypothetical protein ACOYYS_19300 [Chloroflexota bacterium]
MSQLIETLKAVLRDIVLFCQYASGITLREYQKAPLRRILDSIINRYGDTIVVIFPRQSGKNEIQGQLETYLLMLLSQTTAEIVKVSPTWKPQTLNAMRRLERILAKNLLTATLWRKVQGYIYRIGMAMIYFFSGHPESNIVGATASTLLEVDEAQDVSPEKYDKEIEPMAASTNATRVFWGTAWTSNTLLAREKKAAEAAQAIDGRRRVFVLTADDVRKEVPAYGKFVDGVIAKLGRNNPMVRTQYFSEEIDAEGGMFPPSRIEAITGRHRPLAGPQAGELYAALLDVGGEDEAATLDPTKLDNPKRDSTSLTIVRVIPPRDDLQPLPVYESVYRRAWIGTKHTDIYGQLRAELDAWQPRYIVVDATGVGAGLSSMLAKTYRPADDGGSVVPFLFTASSKSKLGWDFLGVIDSGRFHEHTPANETLIRQMQACQYEIIPGPGKLMKWSVPETARDQVTGELIHDDVLLSTAMVALLDAYTWLTPEAPFIVRARDPLADMDEEGF